MATRGRKPKPIAIKRATGNPGRRPLVDDIVKPPQLIVAKPPYWMDRVAKAEWRRLAPELVACGVLTPWDLNPFECYCRAWSDYLRLAKKLSELVKNEDGELVSSENGVFYQHALVSLRNTAEKRVREWGALLGLDPSSRSRLSVKPPSDSGLSQAEEDFGT